MMIFQTCDDNDNIDHHGISVIRNFDGIDYFHYCSITIILPNSTLQEYNSINIYQANLYSQHSKKGITIA